MAHGCCSEYWGMGWDGIKKAENIRVENECFARVTCDMYCCSLYSTIVQFVQYNCCVTCDWVQVTSTVCFLHVHVPGYLRIKYKVYKK